MTEAHTEAGSHLKSDIAQFCFPAASRDVNAKYAYANSIFLAFIAVGIVGIAKTPHIVQKSLPEVVDMVPVEIEQVQDEPPPQAEEPERMEEPSAAQPDSFTPVVVAAANAAVAFPVEYKGPAVVSPNARLAAAPPAILNPPQRPAAAPKPEVTRMSRGKGGPPGNFPNPPFIANVMRSGETAVVEILIEVAPDGSMTSVEVAKSSGIFELDRKIVQHIKNRWRFDPPGEVRRYIYPHEQRVQ